MQQRPRSGPLLGIAGVLTIAGAVMFGFVVPAVVNSQWGAAIAEFVVGVVASIFAFKSLVVLLRLRQRGGG